MTELVRGYAPFAVQATPSPRPPRRPTGLWPSCAITPILSLRPLPKGTEIRAPLRPGRFRVSSRSGYSAAWAFSSIS